MTNITFRCFEAEDPEMAPFVRTNGQGTKYIPEKKAIEAAISVKAPVFCNDGYFFGICLPDGVKAGHPAWWDDTGGEFIRFANGE